MGLLGTADEIDPKMGGRVFRTRSSEELPGITTIAEWAMASGLGRVTGGQVRYGRPDPQLRLSDEREEAREPTAELAVLGGRSAYPALERPALLLGQPDLKRAAHAHWPSLHVAGRSAGGTAREAI